MVAMPREQTQTRGQCTRTQRRRCGEQGLRLAQHKRCSGGVRVRPGIARALSQPVPIAALSRALTSARPVSLCRACLLRSGAACPRARAPRHALLRRASCPQRRASCPQRRASCPQLAMQAALAPPFRGATCRPRGDLSSEGRLEGRVVVRGASCAICREKVRKGVIAAKRCEKG